MLASWSADSGRPALSAHWPADLRLASSRSRRWSQAICAGPRRPSPACSASPMHQAKWRSRSSASSPDADSCSCANSRIVSRRRNRLAPRERLSRATIDLSDRPASRSRILSASNGAVEQTASAAETLQPPAKTASRRRSVCSSAVSRSKLHSRAARSVRCLAGWVRMPRVSSWRLRSSRSAISAGCRHPTHAAANSIARGTPSRRRQISMTAGSSGGRAGTPASVARSRKSWTASSPPGRWDSRTPPTGSPSSRRMNSPGMPSGSRLVQIIRSPEQAPRSVATSPAQAPRTCSQLSRIRSRG
nr:hypothetical protein [uncultured bacterium]